MGQGQAGTTTTTKKSDRNIGQLDKNDNEQQKKTNGTRDITKQKQQKIKRN